ncbi:pilus assembly FimT family protein [Pyxidicoccus xibeiensis]|uniref:pilus assembly FimT family protein n=1 Tax=Pyxidicoccus xibeiensis TaxID=2906759 RepID=UPI0020A7C3A8|nr:prepilin-type N-terminal cleavage/methylation domain-containing protein [Pyxidicoccus xibeiensis]MCP3136542.1 prepilin-type N-terminal cleavage/methylation domain-containing protein [Pyxidicoccus xibeiensis]
MSTRHARGITLLELMVTLAVAGALITLALVNFQQAIDRQRETEATRELWSSALRARQRALATNQPVRFVVEAVARPGGTRTVVRWERLRCENTWDNDSCPRLACVNTTCRANPECCDEVGPELVLPRTMNAASVHGLCYLPGTSRAVRPGNLGCMRGQVDNAAALNAAAPGNLRLTFTSPRARSLLRVEPLTGLANLLDCDSAEALQSPVAECTSG